MLDICIHVTKNVAKHDAFWKPISAHHINVILMVCACAGATDASSDCWKFPKFMIWNCDQAYIVAIFQYEIVVKVLRAFLAGSSPWIVPGEG